MRREPKVEEGRTTVKKGEFVALIGSSGIGKSTIMKLLLSVYQPNEGEIFLRLQDAKEEPYLIDYALKK